MGPKVLNQPLDVESAKLAAPPKRANALATGGQLLTMWKYKGFILDHESGEKYHLAFYHPDYGWRACRWDEEHGAPFFAHPTESAIWVGTRLGKLIYISVGDEIGKAILASVEKSIPPLYILHADADNLWIQEESSINIMQLRLQKDGLTIVNDKPISCAYWVYPLEDGAWIVVGNKEIYVFQSPLLEKQIYHEDKGIFYCYLPFLVRKDEDFCYTEDPRRGWKKMPISIENERDEILFFAQHNDIYLAAVYRHQRDRTLLYRFSGESETDAEYMREISGRFHPEQFAMYNGLVCITDDKPLVISGREDVHKKHQFLVLDPRSNTFYKDIPQFSVMHARSIIPHKLQIPMAWSDRGKGQDIQGSR